MNNEAPQWIHRFRIEDRASLANGAVRISEIQGQAVETYPEEKDPSDGSRQSWTVTPSFRHYPVIVIVVIGVLVFSVN